MTQIKEREALKAVYPNPRWAIKVEQMTDTEVVAVYLRLKSQNKL